MPNLVLEIGTEEMPAVALPGAIEQLREALPHRLKEARLTCSQVQVLGTPRRLVAIVQGLPERQADAEREVRGPAWQVAFGDDGRPTGAALGFARKQGVPVDSLKRVETPQGPYVLARVVERGKPTTEALGPILEECLRSLTFPKTMRWGERTVRFVRPVRWILCLLDAEVVPLEFAGIRAGRATRGHRYLAGSEMAVEHADAYPHAVRSAFVMVDPEERRRAIVEQAERLAAQMRGRVPWDEDLLVENVHLVEWPTCLLGHYDERFLQLPRPVLVMAMKKHQRFFPVEDDAGRLLPCFISVRNGGQEHIENVRAGNEAVLTARFADAQHFYEHDRTVSMDSMAERLERLLFQENLGTMAAKRDRLVRLARALAAALHLTPQESHQLERAAYLCKADLTSEMVVELPALQGVMGREYALMQGEDPVVAHAIAEHYKPRNATDTTPATGIGKLLAVADRMDTLVGYAGLGITPSGSADPFGLRRAAQGVAQILMEDAGALPLLALEILAADGYHHVNGLELPEAELGAALRPLFEQRVDALLEDRGVRYDLRAAALHAGLAEGFHVHTIYLRGHALQTRAADATFVPTVQAAARVANILGLPETPPLDLQKARARTGMPLDSCVRADLDERRGLVATELFCDAAEHALYDAALSVLPPVTSSVAELDFCRLYEVLQTLCEPVNAFFDDVLVMTDDPAVRDNRLALLRFVDGLFRVLADFRKVVVA